MRQTSIVSVAVVAALVLADLPMTNIAQAGMFDMMNPSRWFGNNDRDYHYGRGYGYGPGHYGGWGGPYGGYPGGYGGYPGGWGGYPGGWGYPGYYGHPYGVAPATGSRQQPAPRLPE